MRRILCVVMAMVFVLSLSACGSDKESFRVSYDLAAEPLNLDPQTANDQASLTVINNIFEGLFTINSHGELENALALSHAVSPNGLTYTFTLRKDANWAGYDDNGETILYPVTAHDFVFAFRRLLRPDTNSAAASQYYCIKNAEAFHNGYATEFLLGVAAPSDDQLQIELTTPNENFLRLLASTYAMPCNEDFFTATRGKYGLEPDTIMANGPFDLRSWKHGESVRLVKNESYYAAEQVLPTGVNLWISKAGQSGEARLLDETVDAAVVKGENIASLSGKGFNAEPIENAVWGLYINQKNSDLLEENIRKGIACAFDRRTYRDKLPANLAVATALIPHGAALYGENYREYAGENLTQQFDAARAYEYFKAGLENLGKKSVSGIRLLVNADSGSAASQYFQDVSQILQKELSLFISIDQVTEKEYSAKLRSGDFDIAFYRLEASDNTPWSVLSQFLGNDPRNVISYSNGQLDQLLALTIQQTSREQVMAAYKEAEQMILDTAVFIPMVYSTDYFVTRQDTTGIDYNPQTGLVSFRLAARK